MQLIGARKWFIQRPFLFRHWCTERFPGFWQRRIWLLVNYTTRTEDLVLIENKDRLMMLSAALVVLGMLVAIISSYYFAIRKYLKMSLDELY